MVKAGVQAGRLSLDQVLTLVANDKSEREIFCAPLQISMAEFYKAGEQGLKPEIKAAIDREEYNGEQVMIFEGEKYAVLRSYERSDGLLELTGTRKVGLR